MSAAAVYSPLSDLDQNKSWTLPELSSEKASRLAPSVVYLTLLAVVGVIGNGIVLAVYYCKFHSSTHRCFILVLAAYDCFSCAVGAPFAVGESFHAYTYTDVASCKIFRFILYYCCIASSFTLVLIAFERFRKICTPLKTQMTVPMAKKAVVLVAGVMASVSACPALIMFGNATIPTGVGETTGTKCFISDFYDQTIWPTVFNVYLLVLAFACTVCMGVCYGGIAITVSKMGEANVLKRNTARVNGRPSVSNCASDDLDSDSQTSKSQSGTDAQYSTTERESIRRQGSQSSTMSGYKSNSVLKRSSKWANKVLQRMSSKSGRKTIRITKMLTAVTVAFVLSYLPHLTLMLWSMFTKREDEHTLPKDNVYQVIFYSFLINNIVNPFIYASMDLKFRKEAKDLLRCSRG